MIVTILVILTFLTGLYSVKTIEAVSAKTIETQKTETEVTVEEIAEKLIRFHVIANSDGEEDQALKLKVRDEVLKYIQPKLKDSESIEISREILKKENENIINLAKEVIEENGYDYSVESTLSREYFPVKTYGNITLPQGEYEAYRIIIGSGEGKNWWCVMFPPICFVDITKGEVAYEETENEMKQVLNEKEFEMVNNNSKGTASEDKKGAAKSNTKTTSKAKVEKKVNSSSDTKNTNGNDNTQIVNKNGLIDNSEDKNVVIRFKLSEIFKNLFN